jgi:pilus assembly protein CpaD
MTARARKDIPIMSRTKTFAALVALGIGATACAPAPQHLEAANNPSLYSVHQPVVERTDFVFDVATTASGVSATELARLDAWFASIDLGYGDQVTIDEAPGYQSAAVRRDVSGVAARYGLLLAQADAPITAGTVQPGSVRVVASRAVASVPGCPNWAKAEIAATGNTSSNYGCATNSNLAAMIANPTDLVEGQRGPVTAGAATRAIRSYREVQPTGQQGLQQTNTTGGSN